MSESASPDLAEPANAAGATLEAYDVGPQPCWRLWSLLSMHSWLRVMFICMSKRCGARAGGSLVRSRRRILHLAGAALLAACHSQTTESEGVPKVDVPRFDLHEFYRLVAINGDTARVFPHDTLTICPRAATTYQWSTLTFALNTGQLATLGALWHPLCPTGSPYAGTGQSVASYTQNGSALTFMFTFSSSPITGRISANSDTITLENMLDISGDPTWINTAKFSYVVCSAGPCQ